MICALRGLGQAGLTGAQTPRPALICAIPSFDGLLSNPIT
jgi:hypothetical protein